MIAIARETKKRKRCLDGDCSDCSAVNCPLSTDKPSHLEECWVITDLGRERFFSDVDTSSVYVYSKREYAQIVATELSITDFFIELYKWDNLVAELKKHNYKIILVDFPIETRFSRVVYI